MKKFCFRVAGALVALAVLGFVSCPEPDGGGGTTTAVSATPAATVTTVAKTSATQQAVTFTLTSTNDGVWKVYSAASGGGGVLLTDVTADFTAPDLTLTASGADLAARIYYVSVTEEGKTESARLALTVQAQQQSATPMATVTTVAKNAATVQSVSFTLTSSNTGTWYVYDVSGGGAPLADVTAAFSSPNLTLTASGADIAAGNYFVSVTETGKTESHRLALTVAAYAAPGQSAQPIFVTNAVPKTAPDQATAVFTLTAEHTGATWKVYATADDIGITEHTGVNVSVSGVTLTLTATSGHLPAGDYYVTVLETGDTTESPPAILNLEPYPPGAVITIAFGALPVDPVTVTGNAATLAKSGSMTVTVDNGSEYASFEWWLNGVKTAITAASYTLNGSDFTLNTTNRLAVFAVKDGVPFSKELVFKVTN